ncbi:metal-sensitive transcriptional regulator [Microbacterium aurum]|uniref:metal-sensitive transcriptional regulator n=1 Tax=Microbacterium aurum TaxID=36805 RepID=UPI000DB2DA68|nr:metal-sensitive transcriptional regulator [Microbacterium aurum]PZU49737.1 MAG: transcriptional regulator [Microbacterium sp.]
MILTGTDTERAATQKKILNRLRRAQGQLAAVVAAVEGGGSCRDVVTQLAAVTSALDRAGFAIISTAMRDCMVDPEGSADAEGLTPDDVEKLFLSLA